MQDELINAIQNRQPLPVVARLREVRAYIIRYYGTRAANT